MANEFKVKNGLIVSGSADFEQDLRVRGTLTVDELHTSITTSSVIFESGSTAFGNTFDDTHTLTGSVNITGSITLNGQAIGTGKLDETTFQTYTSSYKVATSDFNGLTSSYNSFTTSYISHSSSFNSRVGSLESFSSSLDASFVNEVEFALFSSSIKTFTSSLNNYTNSLENKLNVIDSTTSSLNTFTSSANSRLNSIESATASLYSFSSSVNNRLTTVETSTGSLNTFSSSTNNRLNAIETSTSSLNSYSSSNDVRLGIIETSTSSLNSFTSSINTTIKNKLNADGVISGSSQILNGSNVVSSSTQITNYGFAITGSNLFKGTQTLSGSIIPSVDNTYDLGSPEYQWRDVYISSGSLYIDGTKVISSTAQELQITTDNGQSIKILEGGTDSIILQTADGDIELKSNADGDILLDPTNGKIMLKGAVEILNGNKIQSSVNGTPVVFASDIVVSGSIDITGTIEGINLTDFSSSINTRVSNLETSAGSLNSFTSSTNTRLGAIETTTSSLNTFTSSTNTKLGVIETTTASLNSYTSSNNTRLGVIETTTGSLNTFTSSANTRLSNLETSSGSLNSFTSSAGSRLTSIETSTSSLNTFTSSINTTIKNRLNTEGVISGSVQINITDTTGYSTFSSSISSSAGALSSSVATTTNNLSTSVATYNLGQDNRLSSIEGKTGSYATTGSNTFIGNQIITGSIYISENLIVAGSSSIQHISSSVVNIADNIITVNAQNPAVRFGGLAVIDSGSSPQVSGSLLFDATENEWIFVHQNQTSVTSALLIMGPETYNDIGNEIHLTNNRLVKSTNDEHVGDSNITDNGTTVSINSNTEITGGLVVTGTVSGTNITTIQSSVNSLNSYTSSNTTNINAIQTATASLNSYTSSTNTRLGVIETTTGSLNTFTSSAASRLSSLETASGSIRTDFNSYTSSNNSRVNAIETSTSSLNTFTSSINTTIKNRLNAEGVLSGSSQVSFGSVSGVPSGLVSGSSQVSYTGLSNVPSGIVSGSSQVSYPSLSNIPSGIVSGSSQITYSGISGTPSGIVSGSAQIDLTATTNYSSGIKTRLNAENVLSSSAQVVSALPAGTVSGSSQVLAGTTIHSGSFFNGISVVSGSGQISFGGITGVPSGLVSGSSQITFGSISSIPSGLVSGSSQITYSSISSIPSGIVSGSAQLTSTFVQKAGDTMTGALTAPGITSSAGLTVSGTSYYTFNKPSTTNYQTVALFGSTANGIFITSDSGIISRGAFFNGGWQATSTTGAYLNFNTSGGGMDLNVFSGATIGGSATFTSLFTVARDNFSFNSNSILHAGNYNSYSPTLTGTGASGNWGINITGNAGTVTNGVYTTGDQTIAGTKTFSNRVVFNSAIANRPQFPGGILGLDTSDGDFDIWGISRDYYPSHPTAANAWGLRWNGTNNDFEFVGGGTNRVILDMDSGNITSTGTISASNFSGTSSGTNTGDQTNITGNAGTVTNGVYTTGNQTIGGVKTFSDQLVLNKSGTQLKISRADTAAADWFFHSWTSGLNIYPNAAGTVYFGRDGSATNVDVYNGTLYQQGNAVIHAGNIGSQTVASAGNSTTVGGISPIQFFNNMGQNHSTQTDFNSISNFGFRFVQGSTNGPGTGSSQFYGFSIGLGNDYAFSDYALQLAMPRYNSSDKYFSFRTREAGTWGSWSKISAGYADSAGSVSGANVSGNISGNASNITSYTINQSVGTSNTVQFSSLGIGVSPALTLHARGSGEMVRFENTSTASDGYTQLNFKAGSRNGYIWLGNQNTSSWAGAGGLNIYTENGNMDFWTNATQRVRIQSDGHMVPFINGTYNLGSSSLRWNTVFTSDLSLSNGIGDYTIVEGENDLFLYNNKQNKVYKFMLQEVNAEDATPKRPE